MSNSKSWKITKPFLVLLKMDKKGIKSYQLYKRYRKVYPGLSGLLRVFKLVKFGGFKG